ncbi:transcriptional repressor [Candidatus Roizmanbacteria bacterium]|nr:transcriptional repressor [Candidatus Roizmanbacteria bacterium]
MKPQHDCKTELREVSLRATPARMEVLKFLETISKPVDVQTLIEYLDKKDIKTDPATVFRIVSMFRQKGLLTPVQFNEGKFRYELSSRTDHHHLVCDKCGDIGDISNCNILALEKDIEKRKEFKVINHSLEFFGICKKCQR